MSHFVGLDVGKAFTSVCVLDAKGAIVEEAEVETTPKDLVGFLRGQGRRYRRVGLEAGDMTPWLYTGLVKAGLPAIPIHPFHAHRLLSARRNKTDRNDARGIAELMRVGTYKAIHVKSDEARRLRALLVARQALVEKRRDIEMVIRGILRGCGLKLPAHAPKSFDQKALAFASGDGTLWDILQPLFVARDALSEQARLLETRVQEAARADAVCRRLMTAPGVGEVTALTFRAVIDEPGRFPTSRSVGVHLGLTPRTRQSATMETRGNISRWGDSTARKLLFMAAMTVFKMRDADTALHRWARSLAARMKPKKAIVAVARKLAVILHRMWVDGTTFDSAGGGWLAMTNG